MENELDVNEDREESASAAVLPLIDKRLGLTIRDDQQNPAWLLDAARLCRRKGARFRLIDSGVLDRFQLEWLMKEGVDFYSSDEARADFEELENLRLIGRGAGGRMIYFLRGRISPEEGESDGFLSLGRYGVDYHVSSREQARDIPRLIALSQGCRVRKGRLVYYHHGGLDPALEDLAATGAWIHMADVSLKGESEFSPVFEIVKAGRSAGAGLILHLEKGLEIPFLKALLEARALVLFKLGQFDYRSPLRSIEKAAARRKPPARSFYLYSDFMP